jgi:hypothetical protein
VPSSEALGLPVVGEVVLILVGDDLGGDQMGGSRIPKMPPLGDLKVVEGDQGKIAPL